jgi:hypothetical protein
MGKRFSGTIVCEAGSDAAEALGTAFLHADILSMSYQSADISWESKVLVVGSHQDMHFLNNKGTVTFDLAEAVIKAPKPKWYDRYRGYVIRDAERGASYIGSYTGRSWVTEKKNAERFTKQEAMNFIQDPGSSLREGKFVIEDVV